MLKIASGAGVEVAGVGVKFVTEADSVPGG